MEYSKYIFCGCCLEIESEEKIKPEKEFSTFLSDFSTPDYKVRIIKTHSLPPKDGALLFNSDRRKIYFDGNNTKVYTAYVNSKLRKYEDYACKVNHSELYINHSEELREVTVFECMDLPSMLLERDIGIIHCSFVQYNGSAILFVGDKQVGKSTQAALWEKHKAAEIINGDRAAVYFSDGKLYAEGVPFCGTSKICKNKKIPVKALICLSKGPENNIKRVSAIDGFMKIMGKFTYSNTKEYIEKISSLTGKIAENTPIFEYSCLKDESAVDFLDNVLLNI